MSLLQNFQKEIKKIIIWQKGRIISGYDPDQYRYDDFGNLMIYDHYDLRNLISGWQIDHDTPVCFGGRRPPEWQAQC